MASILEQLSSGNFAHKSEVSAVINQYFSTIDSLIREIKLLHQQNKPEDAKRLIEIAEALLENTKKLQDLSDKLR